MLFRSDQPKTRRPLLTAPPPPQLRIPATIFGYYCEFSQIYLVVIRNYSQKIRNFPIMGKRTTDTKPQSTENHSIVFWPEIGHLTENRTNENAHPIPLCSHQLYLLQRKNARTDTGEGNHQDSSRSQIKPRGYGYDNRNFGISEPF